MKIDYREFGKKKIASIWLTNEEQQTETARVNALTESLSQEGYITVIYRSGSKDLETYTKGLLRQNLSAT